MDGSEVIRQYKAGRRDFSGANLFGANLSGANLSGANLSGANLSGANLSDANLRDANLNNANLSRVICWGTRLVKSHLKEANLYKANFYTANLYKANLQGANLVRAHFYRADISGADCSNVNLQEANLSRIRALNTNLEEATLTGACIEDWNYNSATNLDNIICDYIYLKHPYKERRPSSGNFAPGDFTRLFHKAVETVDLIFRDGIDWQSFAASFQQLREEQRLKVEGGESNLSIRAIESRDDGSFVIRVNAPAQLDKAEIEESFKRKYEKVLEAREEVFRIELKAKDEQISIYRQHNTSLERIVDTLASRPVQMNNNNSNQSGNFGIGQMNDGEVTANDIAGNLNAARPEEP